MATKRDLLKLIRMNCAECMGGPRVSDNIWPIPHPTDVESCSAVECGFYEYRLGKDPHPGTHWVNHGKRLAKYQELQRIGANLEPGSHQKQNE